MTSTVGTVYFMGSDKYGYLIYIITPTHISLQKSLTYFHLPDFVPSTPQFRMSCDCQIMSPPTIDYWIPSLYPVVNICAGPELRQILSKACRCTTDQLKQELCTISPTSTDKYAWAMDAWITRLNVIRSGLGTFIALMGECGTSTATQCHSHTMTPSTSGDTTAKGTTLEEQAGPTKASIKDCLERDQYECLITGSKFSNGPDTKVVPIIPFALENQPSCRSLDFWKMLEMFYGTEATDTIYTGLTYSSGSIVLRTPLLLTTPYMLCSIVEA